MNAREVLLETDGALLGFDYLDTAAGRAALAEAPRLTAGELSRLCRRCGSIEVFPLRDDKPVCVDRGLCDWRVAMIEEHARLSNPPKCRLCGMSDMALTDDGVCFMRKCVDDWGKWAARLLRARKWVARVERECGEARCPRGPYDPQHLPCFFFGDCPVGK